MVPVMYTRVPEGVFLFSVPHEGDWLGKNITRRYYGSPLPVSSRETSSAVIHEERATT